MNVFKLMKQDKTDEKREDTSMKENNVLIFRIINQVYYSPTVDNCRERRSITRNFNNNYNNLFWCTGGAVNKEHLLTSHF